MVEFNITGEALWTRMERAVEKVNERLRKTVRILEDAKVPYAVIGGHAVRAWVAQVDEAAMRTTRDVDILVRPADLASLIAAMTNAGFHHRNTAGLDMFVEQPDASARDGVHIPKSRRHFLRVYRELPRCSNAHGRILGRISRADNSSWGVTTKRTWTIIKPTGPRQR